MCLKLFNKEQKKSKSRIFSRFDSKDSKIFVNLASQRTAEKKNTQTERQIPLWVDWGSKRLVCYSVTVQQSHMCFSLFLCVLVTARVWVFLQKRARARVLVRTYIQKKKKKKISEELEVEERRMPRSFHWDASRDEELLPEVRVAHACFRPIRTILLLYGSNAYFAIDKCLYLWR